MIENLPEGTSIGEMKASLQWILTHTARFAGLVIVTVQGSRGFILVNLGKPLAYYFRHGNNILKGPAAYEYFQSLPLIQFELMKYSALEMALAIGLTSEGNGSTGQVVPEENETIETANIPVPAGPFPGWDKTSEAFGHQVSRPAGEEMESADHPGFMKETAPFSGISRNGTLPPEGEQDLSIFPHVPVSTNGNQLERKQTDVGELILGQIINLPGVLAVTIFRRGLNVLSIGDINPQNLVDVAEDLIESTKRLSSVMRTGPFIQVTLQVPSGNIIIAPFYDEYACILTSPGINLGQVRKIIRELPGIKTAEEPGEAI